MSVATAHERKTRHAAVRTNLVPEVVQTSAMDCGPASLACLLAGHGIRVAYGRLREACQTDVDGTSIDTLEEVANRLGLDAQQAMMPLDHLLLDDTNTLPAIVVTRLPSGVHHFVVVWRRHGGRIQVMDPATGRRFAKSREFLDEVHVHTHPIPVASWTAWSRSEAFVRPLVRRMNELGIRASGVDTRLDLALADPTWAGTATLDAAVRMAASWIANGAVRKGREASKLLDALLRSVEDRRESPFRTIPDAFWTVYPAPPDADGSPRLYLRGAVVLTAQGVVRHDGTDAAREARDEGLSPELEAARSERPRRPAREFFELLRRDGLATPAVWMAALGLAALGVVFEALLFRGLIEVGRDLDVREGRLGAMTALIAFAVGFLILELPLMLGLLRMGRRLELRLRIAFQSKISRLGDRYFRSRLSSDMAERSHTIHALRHLPSLGGQVVRSTCVLALTTLGIAWIDARVAPFALIAAAVSVALPLVLQRHVAERDLRVRTHIGALTRFYLDALLGLVPLRAHAAERAVEREHESLLCEWVRASLSRQRAVVVVEGLVALSGYGMAAWVLFAHLGHAGGASGVLLLTYWVLSIPAIGSELGLAIRQYPAVRNVTLRLLEPLGAPDDDLVTAADTARQGNDAAGDSGSAEAPVVAPVRSTGLRAAGFGGGLGAAEIDRATLAGTDDADRTTVGTQPGVTIRFDDVVVRAAGHTILDEIRLDVGAGEHIAIVGASGAGKSSLVGLLLGWHRPASGNVLVDEAHLDGAALAVLRRETAWVDPAVQIWNRSMLDNLGYGTRALRDLDRVLEEAELRPILERLPDGLATRLGEGGGLVSGGEGQRVRLGRAWMREGTRLAILDEPFRGLQREQRRELLARARRRWRSATLLCVTHDIAETLTFERVVVVEDGRIAEVGAPRELHARADSRYRALFEAERTLHDRLFAGEDWRRVHLADGKLEEIESRHEPGDGGRDGTEDGGLP